MFLLLLRQLPLMFLLLLLHRLPLMFLLLLLLLLLLLHRRLPFLFLFRLPLLNHCLHLPHFLLLSLNPLLHPQLCLPRKPLLQCHRRFLRVSRLSCPFTYFNSLCQLFHSTPGPEKKSSTFGVKSCGGAPAISISNFAITYVLFFSLYNAVVHWEGSYDRFNHSVEFSMIANANQDNIHPT
jgi:hypothetical protein